MSCLYYLGLFHVVSDCELARARYLAPDASDATSSVVASSTTPTISPTNSTGSSGTSRGAQSGSKKGILIAVIVAAMAIIGLLGVIAFLLMRYKRRPRRPKSPATDFTGRYPGGSPVHEIFDPRNMVVTPFYPGFDEPATPSTFSTSLKGRLSPTGSESARDVVHVGSPWPSYDRTPNVGQRSDGGAVSSYFEPQRSSMRQSTESARASQNLVVRFAEDGLPQTPPPNYDESVPFNRV